MSESFTKEDVIKVMKDKIQRNWLDGSMNTIDRYEQAITLMSGRLDKVESTYQGRMADWDKLMLLLQDYPELNIDNIYDCIYKNQPWHFMEAI
jgi:hypothetical protein